MEEKLYKIHEVAKLHDITKKTILYYEQIGLFMPYYIDESNGYRYYRRVDFPILKQIIYLKDIGFALLEIKEILESRSHELMLLYLKKKQKEVQRGIEDLRKVEEGIRTRIAFNEVAKEIKHHDLNRPSLKIYKERKILGAKGEDQNKESVMLAYREVLHYLRKQNMFSQEAYGSIYYAEKNLEVGAFIELPSSLEIEDAQVLPSGKYICMYHKGSYYSQEAVGYFVKWLKDNQYEMIGNIYDYCIVDRCFSNNENEMILELQVKVK